MKKILKMFCLILIFTMIFPVVIQASEDNHQTGNLFGGEQEKFEKLVGESQEIKRAHPGDAEKEIKIIMDNQPLGIERGIMDIWNVLTDSEKTLYIRYPFDVLKANKEKNIAKTKTEAKFGLNSLGDKSDAFRHGIWNAELTVLIGKEKAELFATSHEDKDVTGNESDGYPKTEHRYMDLHNNAVGRTIGEKNSGASEDEMAYIIYHDICAAGTQFIWLHE